MSQTKKITALEFDTATGGFVPRTCEYEGPVSPKAWNGINSWFLKLNASGRFYPLSPADALQIAVKAAESAADKVAAGLRLKDGVSADTYVIGAAKLAMISHIERRIKPIRETYRSIERRTTGRGAVGEDRFDADNHNGAEDAPTREMSEADGLRGGTPLHVRAERALNRLGELCERILATDRKMGETVVLAFAAYIVCDGNFVRACKLAHISKNRWYRDWPLWCRWARAAAREYGKEGNRPSRH